MAILSLMMSVLLYFLVLPTWMSKRSHKIPVRLTIDLRTFPSKQFYIDKQPSTISVAANITDQEYDQWTGTAYAEADLSNAQAGVHDYPVSLYPPKFRNQVDDANPQATFTLEAVKTRDVPVSVISSGKLNDPSEIVDSLKPEARKVTIEGPASDVGQVVSARATMRLDMLDPHAIQAVPLTLEPIDVNDQVIDRVDVHPAHVMVTAKFSMAPQQKQVFVRADFGVGILPSGFAVKGYSVLPQVVTASGTSEVLSRIAKVGTEIIDISKLTATQTISVPLKRVPGVTFTPNVVQVNIVVEAAGVTGATSKPPAVGGTTSKTGGTGNHR